MRVLGISAFYHDSAAALVIDGEIVAAAQEERFTRKKHDQRFPKESVAYCLRESGLKPEQIDAVVFYEKPFLKFERLVETYLAFAPKGFSSFRKAMPLWVKDKLFQKTSLKKSLAEVAPEFDWERKLKFSEHHLSHAASAFYPSPFEESIVLTMDGVGEWTTTSVAIGKGSDLKIVEEIHFPHSLGLLYSAMTYYTGFKVNSGEYKVMGLAPYGQPVYADLIKKHLIDIKDDGSFRLNLKFFDYCTGFTMTSKAFDEVFGGPPRKPEERLSQKHMDLAASVQAVTEEVVLKLSRNLRAKYGISNLCLAGGVALNCVANGKIWREKIFESIWIQPAAGDAGGALGAALAYTYLAGKTPRKLSPGIDAMKGSYLGPSYEQNDIETRLVRAGARFKTFSDGEITEKTAQALADGAAVGWFQGRMEFGPRALGARSIIADARSPAMQKVLNLKVKFRESFRPFAPSVKRESVGSWFDFEAGSPYMLLVAPVHPGKKKEMTAQEEALFGIEKLNIARSEIPAVTHVDYSARIQTVHAETHPRYYNLIDSFEKKTGCPVIVNTSFNIRGEPIVHAPEDAFKCFMGTDLDVLVVGNCYLEKAAQDQKLATDYRNQFELD